MAEALQEKTNSKSAFCKGVGQYLPHFCAEEDINHLYTDR